MLDYTCARFRTRDSFVSESRAVGCGAPTARDISLSGQRGPESIGVDRSKTLKVTYVTLKVNVLWGVS